MIELRQHHDLLKAFNIEWVCSLTSYYNGQQQRSRNAELRRALHLWWTTYKGKCNTSICCQLKQVRKNNTKKMIRSRKDAWLARAWAHIGRPAIVMHRLRILSFRLWVFNLRYFWPPSERQCSFVNYIKSQTYHCHWDDVLCYDRLLLNTKWFQVLLQLPPKASAKIYQNRSEGWLHALQSILKVVLA